MNMTRAALALLAFSSLYGASGNGSRVLYAGGTAAGVKNNSDARIEVTGEDALRLDTRTTSIRVPYKDIDTLEYGMRVSRRYVEAVLISPVFLVAKKRTHYLTIGYVDAQGKQQAMVLRVGKDAIRPLLVSLEARTGKRVEYQDEDARRAGKG
jgi:hypothetical protein